MIRILVEMAPIRSECYRVIIVTVLSIALGACTSSGSSDRPGRAAAEAEPKRSLLVQASDVMNRTLPQMINSDTRMDLTETIDNTFVYRLTLVNFDEYAKDMDIDRFKATIRQTLLDRRLCDIGFFENPFPLGLIVNYQFSANNSAELFTLAFDKNDCPAPPPTR